MLHLRYSGTSDDAHGHGPLEAGQARLVAALVLVKYYTDLVQSGGLPPSVLEHPQNLTRDQAHDLQTEWVIARTAHLGLPAVLSGGVTWKPTVMDPEKMGLIDLQKYTDSRIAVMCGVPPFLVGLPSGGDSMTYSNTTALFDYHWRAGLRPKAAMAMPRISAWLGGRPIELNRDSYVQPGPVERSTMWAAYVAAGVLTADQVAAIERFSTMPIDAPSVGVLR
jgi:HK97 family phage portal protein